MKMTVEDYENDIHAVCTENGYKISEFDSRDINKIARIAVKIDELLEKALETPFQVGKRASVIVNPAFIALDRLITMQDALLNRLAITPAKRSRLKVMQTNAETKKAIATKNTGVRKSRLREFASGNGAN